MFVQQSIAIDRPAEAAIDHFERHVIGALSGLVATVPWTGPAATSRGETAALTVAPPRHRADACVYALSWPSSRVDGRPEVDLDLEIAPLGEGSSSLQLAGRMSVPWVERWSSEERSAERHCTIAMAALLDMIASRIVERNDTIRH